LDAYARDWRTLRRQICEATLVRRESSRAVMASRQECLDQRRRRLGALVANLAHADARGVERSAHAVGSLLPVASCATARSEEVAELAPPLRDPVETTRDRLAHAQTLIETGQYAQGLARAREAFAAAEKVGVRSLRAKT